jgi:hypothetical protein
VQGRLLSDSTLDQVPASRVDGKPFQRAVLGNKC